jgi:hypothetical protein
MHAIIRARCTKRTGSLREEANRLISVTSSAVKVRSLTGVRILPPGFPEGFYLILLSREPLSGWKRRTYRKRKSLLKNGRVQAAKKKGAISMANSLARTKWMCKYHIVFTPKMSVSSFMGLLKGRVR